MGCVEQEKESMALERFREVAKHLNQHDRTLLRFLRARNLDVKKAEEQLLKALKWRAEVGADSLKYWDPPMYLKEKIPQDFCGFDDQGSPVFSAKWGRYDFRPLLAQGLKDECFRYVVKASETALEILNESKAMQFVCILDGAEFSFAKSVHYATIEFVISLLKYIDISYPETIKKIYMINCPKVFWYSFNIIKYVLSNHTLSKLCIFDADETKWKPALLDDIPVSAIPQEYGGTAKCVRLLQ